LELNQQACKEKVEQSKLNIQNEDTEKDEKIRDLEDTIRDLKSHIEAQKKLSEQSALQDGQILHVPSPKPDISNKITAPSNSSQPESQLESSPLNVNSGSRKKGQNRKGKKKKKKN